MQSSRSVIFKIIIAVTKQLDDLKPIALGIQGGHTRWSLKASSASIIDSLHNLI